MSDRIVTCVYCGHEYPNGTPTSQNELLTAHIAACEKHPMKAIKEQLAAATKRADDAERERDAALAVLRLVEGKGSSRVDECCPCCDYVGMHAPDCALAACLNGGAE